MHVLYRRAPKYLLFRPGLVLRIVRRATCSPIDMKPSVLVITTLRELGWVELTFNINAQAAAKNNREADAIKELTTIDAAVLELRTSKAAPVSRS